MSTQPLAGRRLLITAGPTWVRIDPVRHIGNLSSGRTGLLIAREAARRGAAVTLLFGPGQERVTPEDRAAFQVVDVVTFDDLHAAVREHVGSRRHDALVHAAAVSDYRPVAEENAKLPSGEAELVLRLRPTPKIVDEVRDLDPNILLVKFKLETGRTEEELLRIAQESRRRSRADLVVANDLSRKAGGKHEAYLLDETGLLRRAETTEELAAALLDEIALRLAGRQARAGGSP
jgi:phosphopantothenoylcysteine decarboxylase/phosphopantothenate--cysteine ligase